MGWRRVLAGGALLVAALVPVLHAGPALGSRPGLGDPAPGEHVAPGVVRQTHSYGDAGDLQTYDVYSPEGPLARRPTVVFIHGGSWLIGDKVEWLPEALAVARTGWTAVSINYRLAPQAPWPAPLQDARAALRDLRARADSLGIDPDRIGTLGDSVGGQLGALLGEQDDPVRAVVTWSGVNDMAGLTRQPSAGGCAMLPCAYRGLALKVVRDLMRCTPAECPAAYREASPAALVSPRSPATYAVSSEGELIDPRQAWVMDTNLRTSGVPSRVRILPGSVHGRGNQAQVWHDSLRFLSAVLTPETTPAFPRPEVTLTLDPAQDSGPLRAHVRGTVSPRQAGSTVLLQSRTAAGWRNERSVPLQRTPAGTTYDVSWPGSAGQTTWRVVWRGSGAVAVSPELTLPGPA